MIKKSTILLFFYFLIFHFVYGQFQPNSIGVCYLQKDSADDYHLKIVLPFQTLTKEYQRSDFRDQFKKTLGTINYKGDIILFDDEGEICRMNNKDSFQLDLWCENDGGIQFRPTLNLKIKKANFKKKLIENNNIQNICCFVLINKAETTIDPKDYPNQKNIVLRGDYNQDKKIDCYIWTKNDEAENCDGEPKNNLEIILQIGKQNFNLRCCGP